MTYFQHNTKRGNKQRSHRSRSAREGASSLVVRHPASRCRKHREGGGGRRAQGSHVPTSARGGASAPASRLDARRWRKHRD